ncbi:MAG: phage holin family protein, partial [Actinomycetes bacterium]
MSSPGTEDGGAEVRQEAGRDMAQDPWQSQHRVRDYFGKLIIGIVVLTVTIAIAPGISVYGLLSIPIAVVLTSFLTTVLQPLMIRIAVPFGWFGAAWLAVFGNFIVMYLALNLSPGIDAANPLQTFLATWIYSILMAIVQWVLAIDGDDVFLVQVIRQSTRAGTWGSELTEQDRASQAAGGHPQLGVVFVQLDGMPAPVLDWAVRSGNLPTLSRWIRSGEYTWAEWHSRVPSTTPIAQAGLLHGTSHNMPAFRWYEKEGAELIVANHPPDAAKIEARISDGTGLLADSGVSISNLFSGDAQSRLLVMSGMSKVRKGLGPSKSYASFFTHPAGFTRAFIMTVGEMVKERFQARAQIKRDIVPRISRKGSYVALRAVTNVLLRDLNTALVIEAMMNGSKSIYVDFVDYDEIAHHAGVQRPESLRALEGLDQTLSQLERVVRYAPRPYRFVCVSDHGQSQGSTFKQRYGEPLEDVVRRLMGAELSQTVAATADVEAWGTLNTFLSQLQGQSSVTSGLTRRAMKNRSVDGTVTLGPATIAMAELGVAEQDDS